MNLFVYVAWYCCTFVNFDLLNYPKRGKGLDASECYYCWPEQISISKHAFTLFFIFQTIFSSFWFHLIWKSSQDLEPFMLTVTKTIILFAAPWRHEPLLNAVGLSVMLLDALGQYNWSFLNCLDRMIDTTAQSGTIILHVLITLRLCVHGLAPRWDIWYVGILAKSFSQLVWFPYC